MRADTSGAFGTRARAAPLRRGPSVPAATWVGIAAAVEGVALIGLAIWLEGPSRIWLEVGAGLGAATMLAGLYAATRANSAGRRLREAVHAAGIEDVDGRLVTGPNGEVVFANSAFRALAGAQGPATLGAAVGGDEESLLRLARMAARAATAPTSREDFAVTQPSGARRWLGVVAYPLAGVPGHVAWTVAEVTDERELAKASREELNRLADFFDHAPVGLFSVDTRGRFRLVNDVLGEWLGQNPERMVNEGIRIADFVIPAEGPGAELLPESWSGSWEGEARLVGPNGSSRPVHIAQSAAGGGYTRGVMRDLSAQRKLEETLRLAEDIFRQFFEFSPVGIVMVDASGHVAETNSAYKAMAGVAGASVSARPFLDLVSGADRDRVNALMQRLRSGKVEDAPLDVNLSGPGERTAQLFLRRTGAAAEGDLIVYIVDTTEQKKLEMQFAQSQKMQAVGQLAGGIAHDFNNLLTAMIGYSDLLLQHHQPGDQSFADIMQIKQNANRAANLVRQLLAFSRRQTLSPTVLDLTDVLAELANLVRRLIGENIELKMVHGRDLWTVKVDQGQLEQVMINLAVNARDAMTEGGVLTIRTSNVTAAAETHQHGFDTMPPGEWVLIEVIDSGVGIPQENLVKIFEPFFTTKKVGAGTGLGLSTVYGIIKQTGGYVFPLSEVGKGSNFRIYLPRHEAPVEAAVRRPGADRSASRDLTGKGVVLLVEDEAPVRRFAARALENKGYTVLQAESAEEALDVVSNREGVIDLVITDVVMPGMDGPTLVTHARKARPGLRVIFISGYAEEVFENNLDPAMRYSFLPKPFSLKELASRVKEVLADEA